MAEFLTLYPGQYLPEETEALSRLKQQMEQDLSRKDLSFEEIKATAQGMSRGISHKVTATPEEVQAKMRCLDPKNPLWFSEETAKSAGYEALPAPISWPCPKGGYFGGMNRSFGDITCVKEHHHNVVLHHPIYQGDTLYPVLVDQQVWDATPYEGSTFRTWALRGTGKVYNQEGVLVMTQTCGVKECFRIYADPEKRTWDAKNAGVSEPEFKNHSIHVYTDEDWEKIRGLWKEEIRRGRDILYFEDVTVGDMPPITVDGPYSAPGKGGMMISCSYPSRSDWYVKDHFGEDGLIKDAWGIYHNPLLDEAEAAEKRKAMEEMMAKMPPKPGEKKEPPKKDKKPPIDDSPVAVRGKATFDNFTGRDSALRAIHNYIGDRGRVVGISWCIGAHIPGDRGIPGHPNRQSPFRLVPGMEHRYAEIHGEEGDLSINRLYVTGKRIDEEGRGLIDLTWWCETIEGQIHTEGTATVEVPRRKE